MQAQVAPHLVAAVGQPLLEQEARRRDGAPREHHGAGSNAHLAPRRRSGLHTDGAAAFDRHALDPRAVEKERALLERGRQIGDVDAPARSAGAAEVAEAGALAVWRVAADREMAPAERVTPPRHHRADGPDCLLAGGSYVEDGLDALEVGSHRLGGKVVRDEVLAPPLEDPRRRAEARPAVDRGRAADHASDEDRHHDVSDGERRTVEALVGADGAPVEGVALVVRALFEEDDGQPAGGELPADDRACGARADDDHVALDVPPVPGVSRVHLALPAVLLDWPRDLERLAGRRIEVDHLVDERDERQRLADDRVALPSPEQVVLFARTQRVERPAPPGRRRGVDRGLRRAPGLQERGVGLPDEIVRAPDRGFVGAGQ